MQDIRSRSIVVLSPVLRAGGCLEIFLQLPESINRVGVLLAGSLVVRWFGKQLIHIFVRESIWIVG